MIEVGDFKFEIIENVKDAFNNDEFIKLFTDYFYNFDYIIGDYAYSKLRLKGFYEDTNKLAREHNKISKKDSYIENNCAYNCKYFVLKKI